MLGWLTLFLSRVVSNARSGVVATRTDGAGWTDPWHMSQETAISLPSSSALWKMVEPVTAIL
jgi:hypothetical protein